MKTALDAVIKFKGALPVEVSPPWYFGQNESGFSTYIGFDNRKACAIDEFNALVDELASNFGRCNMYKLSNYKDELALGNASVASKKKQPAKEALDAVIKFEGDYPYSDSSPYIIYGAYGQGYSDFWSDDVNSNWLSVCHRNEFNALVDELASNFGKCDISYQKHCSNEVTRLEGDEMKTVTHEGKVIQIGAVYELSDDGKDWELKVLTEVSDSAWPFFSGDERFSHIRECKASIIGTVTEAPVELVDGECYQFTAPSGIVRKGYFIPVKRLFVCADGNIDVDRCTNIKLLTVD